MGKSVDKRSEEKWVSYEHPECSWYWTESKKAERAVFGIPTSEMFVAAEISKAAKCQKDNQDFKSVDINPGLTQSQQIHLKRLLKERIYKNL